MNISRAFDSKEISVDILAARIRQLGSAVALTRKAREERG